MASFGFHYCPSAILQVEAHLAPSADFPVPSSQNMPDFVGFQRNQRRQGRAAAKVAWGRVRSACQPVYPAKIELGVLMPTLSVEDSRAAFPQKVLCSPLPGLQSVYTGPVHSAADQRSNRWPEVEPRLDKQLACSCLMQIALCCHLSSFAPEQGLEHKQPLSAGTQPRHMGTAWVRQSAECQTTSP